MKNAVKITSATDIFFVIGTSMEVYPAIALINFIPGHCEIYVIDPGLSNFFIKWSTPIVLFP
jgi:NAD-dependent deacetylase